MSKKPMNLEESSASGSGIPERSGDERSESARSGGIPDPVAPKDTEVVQKARRRTYTMEYKRRIVEESSRCKLGELGALLRREGLYHSTLMGWRKQFDQGVRSALEPRKRGPKRAANADSEEVTRLRRENERLRKKLDQAEIIIDAQKKWAAVLDSIREEENGANS